MLESFRREWKIRKTLKQLQQQTVGMILRPGNVWVIEKAIKIDRDTEAALATCLMRGWVEVLEHAVPNTELPPDLDVSELSWNKVTAIYRLTGAGWNAIHRTQGWIVATFLVALLSVIVTVIAAGIPMFLGK